MGLRSTLVRQFGEPHGALGRVAGWVMAHRASNVRRNCWVVDVLELDPTDHVLEIGCGPGIAIAALATAVPAGCVYGVDHSTLMVRQATRRNAPAVRAGQVSITRASVADLPAFEPLDAIIAVNSMGFWPAPGARLKELRTHLRVGGRIAIASQPRSANADAATSRTAAVEIEELLVSAGFAPPLVEVLELDPPVVCVIATNE
ncbi:MAG: class I SAM-dependent methyltransferase [Actinomycetota bacterium]